MEHDHNEEHVHTKVNIDDNQLYSMAMSVVDEKNNKRLAKHQVDKWDYIMVFTKDKKEVADLFKKKLVVRGRLMVKETMSQDDDEIFFYITTTSHDFETVAEDIELKKRLRSDYHGGYSVFRQHKRDKFVLTEDGQLFTSYERAVILHYLITADAGIDVDDALEKGELLKYYPMHETKTIDHLVERYLSKQWWRPIDAAILDDIKDYFGSYITIYFGWLLHYTRWLIPASLVGILMFILQLAVFRRADNEAAPFYSVFVALWATIYIEFWKRRNAELAMDWEMDDFTEKEQIRPGYKGELRYGAYIDGVFVALDPKSHTMKTSLLNSSAGTPTDDTPQTLYSPPNEKRLKIGAGLGILLTFVIMAVIGTLAIFVFKQFINKVTDNYGGFLGGILNAVLIMVLNTVYRKVAKRLTEWENHRTNQDFENSLIVKNFLFQFVNSYISLFYVAFIKGKTTLFGYKDVDKCIPNCMQELEVQLATIFLTQIFVQQFQEAALPFIMQKISIAAEQKKMHQTLTTNTQDMPQAEVEAKLGVYDSTFEDYNEMAIQFGYVTLFAVAFPLAPLAALLNNLIEAKTDLLKLVKGMRRPNPKESADIGPWLKILETISYIAIATNCAMIVWTSDALETFISHEENVVGNSWYDSYEKLFIGIILEHIIFVIKFMISELIPDAPEQVLEQTARKKYFKQKLIDEAAQRKRDKAKAAAKEKKVELRQSKHAGPAVVQLDDH